MYSTSYRRYIRSCLCICYLVGRYCEPLGYQVLVQQYIAVRLQAAAAAESIYLRYVDDVDSAEILHVLGDPGQDFVHLHAGDVMVVAEP